MQALFRNFTAIAVSMALAAGASAATIAEWNFNAATSVSDATTGTGTSSGGFFPFASALPEQTGSPNDANPVVINGGPNNSSAGRSGPNPGEASGTRRFGVNTSTAGFLTPTVTWDLLAGYRTSRYYQIFATADGTNYDPVPNGVGSIRSNPAAGAAAVSPSGLITVLANDGLIDDNTGTGYLHDISYTFPGGSPYENNPDFGVRIAAVHDPAGTDFVSSFAGTDSTDAVAGFIRTTSLGGNQIRYDLVRVTGTEVPEPTGLALAVCGLALVGARRRK